MYVIYQIRKNVKKGIPDVVRLIVLTETILQTNRFTQTLAKTILRLLSWNLRVDLPQTHKYVLIGAPHTSNWDLMYALLFSHAAGIHISWIGKESLFRWPLGILMRWLGGIPVDRRVRGNFVQQVVDVFNRSERLVVAITPEGTRSQVHYWKTGFYYIAHGAGTPIALGFIDYGRKELGIGPAITPSGDIHADFEAIRSFYTGKLGRYHHKQGEMLLRPE
jgi:1-acyl-sn-glycerol-3-phosphate acyltransferase